MKTNSLKNNWMHFTLAVIFTGLLATAARAESFAVQVPFAFEAAGKSFPAGHLYRGGGYRRGGDDQRRHFHRYRRDDRLARALLRTRSNPA